MPNEDLYDVELDEVQDEQEQSNAQEALKQEEQPKEQASPKQEPKGVMLSDDEYSQFQQMQQERTLSNLEKEFKKEYPDFDMKKVIAEFKKLEKTDPQRAADTFNAIGIENMYLKHFKGKSDVSDEFDTAHAMGSGVDNKEMISKINKGEASDEEKLAFYKKIF